MSFLQIVAASVGEFHSDAFVLCHVKNFASDFISMLSSLSSTECDKMLLVACIH